MGAQKTLWARDFVTLICGTLPSPRTMAGIKSLRAFFAQQKLDHAGNRTHVHQVQTRTKKVTAWLGG